MYRRPASSRTAVAVPGSPWIRRQLGGYAIAAPPGIVIVRHPAGGGAGRNQVNAAECELLPQAASRAIAVRPASALDIAVPIAGAAVVVGIMVAAIVLRDSAGRRRGR